MLRLRFAALSLIQHLLRGVADTCQERLHPSIAGAAIIQEQGLERRSVVDPAANVKHARRAWPRVT